MQMGGGAHKTPSYSHLRHVRNLAARDGEMVIIIVAQRDARIPLCIARCADTLSCANAAARLDSSQMIDYIERSMMVSSCVSLASDTHCLLIEDHLRG